MKKILVIGITLILLVVGITIGKLSFSHAFDYDYNFEFKIDKRLRNEEKSLLQQKEFPFVVHINNEGNVSNAKIEIYDENDNKKSTYTINNFINNTNYYYLNITLNPGEKIKATDIEEAKVKIYYGEVESFVSYGLFEGFGKKFDSERNIIEDQSTTKKIADRYENMYYVRGSADFNNAEMGLLEGLAMKKYIEVSTEKYEGPKVGIAIKTVDRAGNPIEGVSYKVSYLDETIIVGPSGPDGYARSNKDAIQLFNTIKGYSLNTITTFGGNEMTIVVNEYPNEYEKVTPIQNGNNEYEYLTSSIKEDGYYIPECFEGTCGPSKEVGIIPIHDYLDEYSIFSDNEYYESIDVPFATGSNFFYEAALKLEFVAIDEDNPEEPPYDPSSPYGEIKIKKYKEGTTEPLKGAVYEVHFTGEYYDFITLADGQRKYSTGNWGLVTTLTTDENGEASTGKILPEKIDNKDRKAKYYIKEIEAPAGYEIDNSNDNYQNSFEITPGRTKEIIRYNKEKQFGEIKIIKIRERDDSILLPGAEFQVINAGNNIIILKDGTKVYPNGVVTTLTTDENGEARTGMILPEDGYYKLVETKAPEGYNNFWNPYSFIPYKEMYDVTANTTTEIIVQNPLDKGGITILKVPSAFLSKELIEKYKDVEFPVEITLKDGDGNLINEEFHYRISNYSNINYDTNENTVNGIPITKQYSFIKFLDKLKFTNGKAVVNLKLNDSLIIFEIPRDYQYEIREFDTNGWYLEQISTNFVIPSDEFVKCYSTGIGLKSVIKNIKIRGRNGFDHDYFQLTNMKLPNFNVVGKKEQVGKKLQKGEYRFEIKDKNNNLVGSAYTDENGKINFDEIFINVKELNRKNINYLEATDDQKKNIKNWIGDSCYQFVIISPEIPDYAFSYFYKGDEYVKTYYSDATDEQKRESRHWNYEDANYFFYFIDKNIEGAFEYGAQPYSLGMFNAIEFSGDLEYTISEVLPEGVSKDNPTKDGITYDTHEEKIVLHVHGYHGEDFDIDVEYDEDGIVFVNHYNEEEEKIEFEVDTKPVESNPKNEEPKKEKPTELEKKETPTPPKEDEKKISQIIEALPKTLDDVFTYVFMFGGSIIFIVLIVLGINKTKNKKKGE